MAGPFLRQPSLEELNASSADSLVSHLGIRITAQGEDWLRGTMPVDARTRQPFGLLYGGAPRWRWPKPGQRGRQPVP